MSRPRIGSHRSGGSSGGSGGGSRPSGPQSGAHRADQTEVLILDTPEVKPRHDPPERTELLDLNDPPERSRDRGDDDDDHTALLKAPSSRASGSTTASNASPPPGGTQSSGDASSTSPASPSADSPPTTDASGAPLTRIGTLASGATTGPPQPHPPGNAWGMGQPIGPGGSGVKISYQRPGSATGPGPIAKRTELSVPAPGGGAPTPGGGAPAPGGGAPQRRTQGTVYKEALDRFKANQAQRDGLLQQLHTKRMDTIAGYNLARERAYKKAVGELEIAKKRYTDLPADTPGPEREAARLEMLADMHTIRQDFAVRDAKLAGFSQQTLNEVTVLQRNLNAVRVMEVDMLLAFNDTDLMSKINPTPAPYTPKAKPLTNQDTPTDAAGRDRMLAEMTQQTNDMRSDAIAAADQARDANYWGAVNALAKAKKPLYDLPKDTPPAERARVRREVQAEMDAIRQKYQRNDARIDARLQQNLNQIGAQNQNVWMVREMETESLLRS
jgi:hypothetical protein